MPDDGAIVAPSGLGAGTHRAPAQLPNNGGVLAYVELKGLTKRFGERPAVRWLDLTLGQGELVSLLGPSGCGKTTTLRMIAGFEAPDAGEVWVGGQNLLELPAHRRGMGVVFQNYALFPHLTAWGTSPSA